MQAMVMHIGIFLKVIVDKNPHAIFWSGHEGGSRVEAVRKCKEGVREQKEELESGKGKGGGDPWLHFIYLLTH
jgi:hypothetical protein